MIEIPYPLRTERLLLRRFVPQDLAAYHAYESLPQTARYLLNEARSLAQSMERVGRMSQEEPLRPGQWAVFAVELRHAPGLLGSVDLKWDEGGDEQHGLVGEIGWIFAPEARGKGYATEAARALCDLAFERLGFYRLQARLDAANTASARLCERLGMQHEGTLRENMYLKGEWTSEAIYGMLRTELLSGL
ncbi:GNAT family N-acetyltransferase [Acaricomes phytoseiuli]|uniref:GNAT family N-acetyltransferase n=1 Tax=Acaricomes phytoseiuli TaxID=291968 RepID=UPI0003738C3F|nr:GNAT family protein [Acaricomes phytoseiuli]MCW1249851.1 GNAT family N-acetyltransferase [Acaricomes phytoseiuli]